MILAILLLLLLALLSVSPLIVGVVLLGRKHVKAGLIVLSIYAGLVGLFVIHGQTEPLSIPGYILRCLSPPPKSSLQPVSDHKPSYKDFVSTHTFPYVASPERQNHLRQNYSLLSIGLGKAEVLEILGEPDYSQQGWSKEVPREYKESNWTYFFEKPDPNFTNLKSDKNIEVFFDPHDRVYWIVSNVEGLGEIGSFRRQDSPSPATNSNR